jgi:hypothetical protein
MNENSYLSNYSNTFGKDDKANYQILNYKKFSEIPLSKYLTPSAKQMIDTWIGMGQEKTLVKELIDLYRSIYTAIKTIVP